MGNNIFKAIDNNDIEKVKSCIKYGTDINKSERDNFGDLPLGRAVVKGHYDICKYLIDNKADINMAYKFDNQMKTNLVLSIYMGHTDIAKYLITNGADIHQLSGIQYYNSKRETPLNVACLRGNLEIVKCLINAGVDPNIYTENSSTPLYVAVRYEFVEIVKYLVHYGADVHKAGLKGDVPLAVAVAVNNLDTVKYLMENGADVNKASEDGFTPLGVAALGNNLDIGKYLMENGADVNKDDNKGITPLIHAVIKGHSDIVEYLVINGNDINMEIIENEEGATALIRAIHHGHINIAKFLVCNGAGINTTNKRGSTPLLYAIHSGHCEFATYLIDNGGDINKANNLGVTPVLSAAMKGHLQVLEYLISKGANINTHDNSGRNALHYANKEGYDDIVELLKNSVNIDDNASNDDNNVNEEKSNNPRYVHANTIMLRSFEISTSVSHNNEEKGDIIRDEINLEALDQAQFDDDTSFTMVGKIGEGAQTCAYLISVNRRPFVLKVLQNDESMADRVVTPAEFSISTCFPFNGVNRQDDYNKYLMKYELVDDDIDTYQRYFKQLKATFESWQVKKYQGKKYSVSTFFRVINESDDQKRDCIRFCYYYYLLQHMKIAHCDVAPRNVLITYEGPVLIDFGASVKFEDININPLPGDVSPQYYLENRADIRPNHDVKGFYYTATKHFSNIIPYNEDIINELDQMNRLKLEDIVLSHCHL